MIMVYVYGFGWFDIFLHTKILLINTQKISVGASVPARPLFIGLI
jgi:hypothetical protein